MQIIVFLLCRYRCAMLLPARRRQNAVARLTGCPFLLIQRLQPSLRAAWHRLPPTSSSSPTSSLAGRQPPADARSVRVGLDKRTPSGRAGCSVSCTSRPSLDRAVVFRDGLPACMKRSRELALHDRRSTRPRRRSIFATDRTAQRTRAAGCVV